MATKIYPLSTLSSVVNLETPGEQVASLTPGASLTTNARNTANGPVSCAVSLVIINGSGERIGWFTNPLDAVTISGTITLNLWMSENNMSANAGAEIWIARCDNSGAWIENILGCNGFHTTSAGTTSEKGTELPVTTRAAQNWTATPTSRTLAAGDRLVFSVQGNDGGGTMATGFTFDLGYSGPTGAADGDSWVQFTETITEQVSTVRVPRSPGVDSGNAHL